jgi:hypothetical protein
MSLCGFDINSDGFKKKLANWKNGKCTSSDQNECFTKAEGACYELGIKRKEVDNSLRMIYQPQNAMAMSLESNFHATMLTGVVWAMLGTTVLYYAFTKI